MGPPPATTTKRERAGVIPRQGHSREKYDLYCRLSLHGPTDVVTDREMFDS